MNCIVFVASVTEAVLLQLCLCDFNISFTYKKQRRDHIVKNTSGIYLNFSDLLMLLVCQMPLFFFPKVKAFRAFKVMF